MVKLDFLCVFELAKPAIQFIVHALVHLNGAPQTLSNHAFRMYELHNHSCIGIEHLCHLEDLASTVLVTNCERGLTWFFLQFPTTEMKRQKLTVSAAPA